MATLSYTETIVICAGFCSGFTIGIFLTTKTEAFRRGAVSFAVDPLERVGLREASKAIALTLCYIVFIAILLLIVGRGVMRLAHLNRLPSGSNPVFAIACLLGAGTGKLLRLLYWRSRP